MPTINHSTIPQPINMDNSKNKIKNYDLAEAKKPETHLSPIPTTKTNKIPKPKSLTFEVFKKECEEIQYISGYAHKYRSISRGIRKAQIRAMRNLVEVTSGVIVNAETIEKAIAQVVHNNTGSYESTLENFKDTIKTQARGIVFPKYKTFSSGDEYKISNKIITVMVKPRCNSRAFRGLSGFIDSLK